MLSSFVRGAPVLAGCLLLACSVPAQAQHPYPYPYPYPTPVVVKPYAGPGGYVAAQAKVIEKAGEYQVNQQHAQIIKQKALQEQIKTQKAQFDWEMYKKANTPTFTQEQLAIKKSKDYRILTNPTEGEIATGEALNVALFYLKGSAGAPAPLDPNQLKKINVGPPGSWAGAGLLRDGGVVVFPLVLKGATQKELSVLLPLAVSACVDGTLDFKVYKQVRNNLDKLRAEHKKNFHQSEIDGGTYLIGTRFLDSLEGSVKELEQPYAAQLFDGTFQAKGNNIQELAQYMAQSGLKFLPAVPGEESAYQSLHAAMNTQSLAKYGSGGF